MSWIFPTTRITFFNPNSQLVWTQFHQNQSTFVSTPSNSHSVNHQSKFTFAVNTHQYGVLRAPKQTEQSVKFLTIQELPKYSTISVNEAAYVSGIGRSTAYEAVKNGEFFETVLINNNIRVLAQPLFRKLMGSAHSAVVVSSGHEVSS